jgi:hypothetical protein
MFLFIDSLFYLTANAKLVHINIYAMFQAFLGKKMLLALKVKGDVVPAPAHAVSAQFFLG